MNRLRLRIPMLLLHGSVEPPGEGARTWTVRFVELRFKWNAVTHGPRNRISD